MKYRTNQGDAAGGIALPDAKHVPSDHPVYRRIPQWFRFDNAPIDATGLSFDFFARATLIMSTVFLGPALLLLATEAANCPNAQDCEERVFGMKPSSLLTNVAILSGLFTALTMPLIGAVVDHTKYRKQVGAWSAYLMSIIMGVQTIVGPETWLYVAILQVFGSFLYNTHIVVTYAYTSELSKDPVIQTKFNSYFFVVLYSSILLFMGEVLGLSMLFQADDIGTARISQILTCVTTVIFFGVSWTSLFTDRAPSTELEEGQSLWTAGFVKVWQTFGEISQKQPSMRVLMFSIMCSEAATATLVAISTTYMVHFLNMNSIEVGFAYFFILTMGIPGAKLGECFALRASPRVSAMLALLFFAAVTAVAAFVLEGPEHKQYMNLFGLLWGTGLGWLHPMNTTMFISLTPTHSQTEYMGIYNFAQSIIGWLPPLVFTIMNEHGLPMNFGLASLNIFFILALFFLCFMGCYEDASDSEKAAEPNLAPRATSELP